MAANNLLGPACCDATVWLCLCGENIPVTLADGESGEYIAVSPNNHPECCAICLDGTHSTVAAMVTRTGNDYEIILSADDCSPCGRVRYCVECINGSVVDGLLRNGFPVTMCGLGGPVITMIDNGDDTMSIQEVVNDTTYFSGPFACPVVGCYEIQLHEVGQQGSLLKIGPDCVCQPLPIDCQFTPYCVVCVDGSVEDGTFTDGVPVEMCGGPRVTMDDNGNRTATFVQDFEGVFTILGTFPCPVVECQEFQLDDGSTLKIGADCVCVLTGCGPLPYCVECDANPGYTQSGQLTDGIGVEMCGRDGIGPVITMTDNGDGTVLVTEFYNGTITPITTLACPFVGCSEFSLSDRSRLKLGPGCFCA